MLCSMLCIASVVSAQYYGDSKNPDMLHIERPRNLVRTEFILPTLDGYVSLKTDLHAHTNYSDGHLTMDGRIREAWADGVDVMAVTEHIEHRPQEQRLVELMKGYVKKGAKAKNYTIVGADPMPKASEIYVDLNLPVKHAIEIAKQYDMIIIPGAEITRTPLTVGHFNALFTKDNNAIHDPDPIQAIRNARAQGALVMHNHPGWRRPNMNFNDFDKRVYAEKLVDGIEVMNTAEFYPKAISRALKYGLFMSSNTDIHHPSSENYMRTNARRNMTFVFAKERSLASIREAIEARRTIAYSFGTLAGEEALLRKFVDASLKARKIGLDRKGRPQWLITNLSSVEYTIRYGSENIVRLEGLSSVILIESEKGAKCVLESVWYDHDKRLEFRLE